MSNPIAQSFFRHLLVHALLRDLVTLTEDGVRTTAEFRPCNGPCVDCAAWFWSSNSCHIGFRLWKQIIIRRKSSFNDAMHAMTLTLARACGKEGRLTTYGLTMVSDQTDTASGQRWYWMKCWRRLVPSTMHRRRCTLTTNGSSRRSLCRRCQRTHRSLRHVTS